MTIADLIDQNKVYFVILFVLFCVCLEGRK